MKHNILRLFLLGLVCVTACRSTTNQTKAPEHLSNGPVTSKSVKSTALELSDNAGLDDWRAYKDLNNLMVAGEHIVISHRDTQPAKGMVSAIAASRTKEEARKKALSLYKELKAHPERFSTIARQHSDDPPTARMGGSLGLFHVLAMPQELISAFGSIDIGQISRPVETAQGYHLLRRLNPPPETQLSISHIVIKHDEATTGWRRMDRPVPSRTRAEALEIAAGLAKKAQQHPEQFGALALEYSDADDALRQGDIGTQSTYERVGSKFLLLSVASRLPIGGVSEVVETLSGAHVILRKPLTAKQHAAASVIVIAYAESQLSKLLSDFRSVTARSKKEAAKIAKELAATLEKNPQDFEKHRSAHCENVETMCKGVIRWFLGRNIQALEQEYRKLSVHGISTAVADSPLGYVILRRDDAQKHPPPEMAKPHFSFVKPYFTER